MCEEYGLSVIQEKPCRNSKINFANYQKDLNNKVNYYSIAKEDLDRAIGMATSYYDFEDLMKAIVLICVLTTTSNLSPHISSASLTPIA